MPSSVCLRCLARPLASIEQTLPRAAAFSTSSSFSANPPKKKAVVPSKSGKPAGARQGKLTLKRTVRASAGKKPGEGERKALRKRVVLSNTNALEVRDMQNLTETTALDESLRGKVLGFSDETVDSLRAAEAFKPTQAWSLFRRPTTLVRKETCDMAGQLEAASDGKTAVRKVIYGEKGSGKSILALQAMAMAFVKGWVVIHVPESQELTLGHTPYIPQQTSPPTYVQPQYTATLLGNIARANHAVLSKLQLSRQHDLPIPVQSNMSLDRFCELGAKDADIAWPVYQALWSELTAPSQDGEGLSRPPVMFVLDSMSHIMRESAYLSAEGKSVHAHDLAFVKHFLSFLSGGSSLPNGGAVLAAESNSNRAMNPALDFALERQQALADGEETPVWDAYRKVDSRVLQALEGVDVWQLHGLDKEEARGIMEYYALSGLLRQTVTDHLVSEKWSLSGNGIVGELERGTVLMGV